MELNKIIQGDVIQALKTLPENSIHCVVTSPPYFGLRDYKTAKWEGGSLECDHVETQDLKRENSGGLSNTPLERGEQPYTQSSKIQYRDICGKCGAKRIDCQIGLEKTPEEYTQKLVEVFREVRRILHPTGICVLNLGDSYASGKGTCYNPGGGKTSINQEQKTAEVYPLDRGNISTLKASGLKPKDLCMIPFKVALALQQDGWWLRSVIPWIKRNCMPESTTDRPTSAIEYLFLLTKTKDYFWDKEAVKIPSVDYGTRDRSGFRNSTEDSKLIHNGLTNANFAQTGRNIRNSDWFFRSWQGLFSEEPDEPLALIVNPRSFKGAHFATFPPGLVEPFVKAGTSEKGVCPDCGKPWERIIERLNKSTYQQIKEQYNYDYRDSKPLPGNATPDNVGNCRNPDGSMPWYDAPINKTIGWQPTCKCGKEPIPAMVLDPFIGSGTTAVVASKLGRNWLGIDLNPSYIELAYKRLEDSKLKEAKNGTDRNPKTDSNPEGTTGAAPV